MSRQSIFLGNYTATEVFCYGNGILVGLEKHLKGQPGEIRATVKAYNFHINLIPIPNQNGFQRAEV